MEAVEAASALATITEPARRESGIVKWFNNEKGFGFIQRKDGGADVFVHHSAIQMKGYRTLIENQPVEFELGASPKGLIAINVVPQE